MPLDLLTRSIITSIYIYHIIKVVYIVLASSWYVFIKNDLIANILDLWLFVLDRHVAALK